MRFSRLRLNGFKSFVDPTDLVIREGLTGIVGPNGCGKSNLLEALRWVMGENRPTAMRGSGMDDVVFAGTATRGARAFAEVTLTVDNAERLAPAGFNDADILEVTRRITRDAGSAYRLNGKEVRARDVQMLFADASTGAHSPALVRQGQISELINAKPRARRRVLEEAAGISGLYQRRHEAELRLNATEANLARVGDVLDQLSQQVQVLARQARQAARYRELGTELRRAEGLMLLQRWREAEVARAEMQAGLAEALRLLSGAERAAVAAQSARQTAEDALPPRREEEAIAGALLQRLQVQRDSLAEQEARAQETIRELSARIEQWRRDAERETMLARDADETISRLTWEEGQLGRAAEGHEDKLAEAAEIAAEAADRLAELEQAMTAMTEDMARLSARHQAAQRQIDEARQEQARTAAAMARAEQDQASALHDAQTAAAALEAAQDAAEDARAAAEAAEDLLMATDEARAEVQQAESAARATLAGAEGEAGALAAECAALERLVARDAPAAGQVLDDLTVAPGFEAALGAALGDDLRAPVTAQGTGWHLLPPLDAPAPLPAGAEPLGAQVQAPPALARRLSQVGVIDPARAATLQPQLRAGQRLVSRDGDLWRWDGLHVRAADAPSAAALRLVQRNRLSALRAELASAEARLDAARAEHAALAARLGDLTVADRAAREARRTADQRLTEVLRAQSQSEAALSRAQSRHDAVAGLLDSARAAAADAADRLTTGEAALADLPDLGQVRDRLDSARGQVDAARSLLMARRAALEDLRREGAARRARAQEVARDLQAWSARKLTAADRVAELERRAAEAADALEDAAAAPEDIAARRAELSRAIETAEARRTAAIEALVAAEAALRAAQDTERSAERAAGEAREARARAEARVDAAAEGVALAAERILEAQDCTPADLAARLGNAADAPPDTAALELDIARLRRAREALGAVNLRAEEDQRTAQAELDALTAERADLEAAVAKLRSGINALNREGRERLLAAFEQVNANFAQLFTHLFGGGEARLVLVESDDPLEAGLEILCQPPGKKLSSLSLLSGGEQTLTALALIFGAFLANPAPICVLDEVDAPLDDANVVRFCDLMDEMTRRTQTRFLIITHNALTMARMDRLFGVTMAERGVSQLVSVDLARAEALVA